jgi:uncharacterized membrane protein YkvA (DUF1232 family)
MHSILKRWKETAQRLRLEISALYLASRDPRVPWFTRLFVICVAGYAFSPIDLIPDPIPVLGYLDDLILLPLGVALAVRLIPREVLEDCRCKAAAGLGKNGRQNWIAGVIVVAAWLSAAVWAVRFIQGYLKS